MKKRQKGQYNKQSNTPNYLDKNGKFILIYTQAHCKIKNNLINLTCNKNLLSKYNLKNLQFTLPEILKNKQIKEVRIKPKFDFFEIVFVYSDEINYTQVNKNNNFLGIDLGVNNFLTCIDNINNKPFIIDGKKLKGFNYYFNKQLAKRKSNLEKINKTKTSKSIQNLWIKRENKFNDSFHKITKILTQYCLENDISKVVIGYNKEWKQNINLGKRNNQNFVQISHSNFIQKLKYKLENHGIKLKLQEESYTSKVDAIALEEIKKQEEYLGERIYRGLFSSSTGRKINADVNGVLNIIRKESNCNKFVKTLADNGVMLTPVKIRNYESNLNFL